MATYQSVFVPTSPTANTLLTATLGATTSTADILIPARTLFAITVSGDCTVRFGNATRMVNAAATDWPIWAKSVQEWEMGEEFDRIRIFNTTGGNINYWIYNLSAK